MAKELSNTELRAELKKYGIPVGPLTDSTRTVYLKKLEKLKNDATPPTVLPPASKVPGLANMNKSPSKTTPTVQENGTSRNVERFFDAKQPDPVPPRKVTRRSIATTMVDKEEPAFRRGTDLSTTTIGLNQDRDRGIGANTGSSTSTFASATASRRSLSSTYQPTSNFSSTQRPAVDDEDKWNSFRHSAFERLKETASNFGLLDDAPKKPDAIPPSRVAASTTKYGSFQNENVPPKYGLFQNENVAPKYASPFQKDKLNNSAADWYRSRLHDTGHWGSSSYTPGTSGAKRGWWQLNANTSRLILYIFGGFVALLAVLYALIMNKNSVKFFALVLIGALVDTGYFVYNHMILPALIVLLIATMIVGAIWYKRHKWHKTAEEQQQIFDMVEKILALLKKHYEECLLDNNRQPYLAVPHVRDMLIPLGKRNQMLPIWEKAVQYLNENESRVRTENQIISGEEFMVWRWLQSAADEKLWQGHAFPEEQAALNSPVMPFSECLKLRGLFDPDLEEEDDWPEHIQDAILEKLGQSTRVMHVAIDTESKEGCVYMKLGSKEEAGAAYQILHGSWFNGRLVTVKYLRVERYHERFPEAQRCTYPLRVKKPRYSLLG